MIFTLTMEDQTTTDIGKRLKAGLSSACWARRVEKAHQRVRFVEAVFSACGDWDGPVSRQVVREHAPGIPWSSFLHLVRRYRSRDGEPWERMLDRRLPSKGWSPPDAWLSTVRALGYQDPQPSLATIRETLVAVHGEEAGLCDNTLRKILREAGLWQSRQGDGQTEQVTELHGGGGLVLLLAAELETGAVRSLAESVLSLAGEQEDGGMARPEDEKRDDRGRFTTAYNDTRHERYTASQVDPFYHSVDEVRGERDLSRLQVSSMGVETLANRLRCILALPLVTERRGVVGLDGPMGAWLAAFSSYPYKAGSAEKTLSELKLLGAGEAMWDANATTWGTMVKRWSESSWRQLVAYVDTTQDPYWTERFTASGKVSRTGRVQPCLSRICLSTGPGIPIFTEVISGTVKLKDHLQALLCRSDQLLGPGELGRVTVVDAECGNVTVLRTFSESPDRDIVTVLKGALRQGKTLHEEGPWLPFRKRDQIREAKLLVDGDMLVRVVEMERVGSRNPTSTWFGTTADFECLTTTDVAEVYLSRWPYQEDLFRRARDGVGLERSAGYGVSKTQNLAVLTRREKAGTKVEKCNVELRGAISSQLDTKLAVEDAKERLEEHKSQGEKLNGRQKAGLRQARDRQRQANKHLREIERKRAKAITEQRKQETMPDEIYVRDTALDSITTCLKMTLLSLMEFVCQEYLGGLRIMPRTFADALVTLLVFIRKRQHEVVYEVHYNQRDPAMMELLAVAFERTNQRQLRQGKRRLVVRMRDGPEWSISS